MCLRKPDRTGGRAQCRPFLAKLHTLPASEKSNLLNFCKIVSPDFPLATFTLSHLVMLSNFNPEFFFILTFSCDFKYHNI